MPRELRTCLGAVAVGVPLHRLHLVAAVDDDLRAITRVERGGVVAHRKQGAADCLSAVVVALFVGLSDPPDAHPRFDHEALARISADRLCLRGLRARGEVNPATAPAACAQVEALREDFGADGAARLVVEGHDRAAHAAAAAAQVTLLRARWRRPLARWRRDIRRPHTGVLVDDWPEADIVALGRVGVVAPAAAGVALAAVARAGAGVAAAGSPAVGAIMREVHAGAERGLIIIITRNRNSALRRLRLIRVEARRVAGDVALGALVLVHRELLLRASGGPDRGLALQRVQRTAGLVRARALVVDLHGSRDVACGDSTTQEDHEDFEGHGG
mmetsp:Transcript_95197/g.245993  ORF Transcript_95197/g.245993 Transcript_95197/m.245993 type:complete len:330 (-) Transcript_95197:91-1080(-)